MKKALLPLLLFLLSAQLQAVSIKTESAKRDPDVYMANPLTDIVTEAHDMGADWHPNYQGQKKIAMCLIPQISAIMGWNLTDKPVE